MDDDHGGGLPPFEGLVRRHIKSVDEFVRQMYPAADPERVVYDAFKQAQRSKLAGSHEDIRLWLFGEARAQARRTSGEAWVERNAKLVVKGLRTQGESMREWHAWSDLNRLIDCLRRLPVDQQEVLHLITSYEDLSPARLSTVLRSSAAVAAELVTSASSALRAAFEDGEPTTHLGGGAL